MNGRIRKPTEDLAIGNIIRQSRQNRSRRGIRVLTEDDMKEMDRKHKSFAEWVREELAKEEDDGADKSV